MDTPPKTVVMPRPTLRPSGASASATCRASSRVGTRTRPRGASSRRCRVAASRASRGRPKASVLPDPVWARPSTSRPASASGRARAWIANGALMSRAASAPDQPGVQAELSERGRRRAATPRRRRPGPGQARNTVLPAAAVGPAGAWPRPDRGAWRYAHRPGCSDPKTRADVWNCGACETPSVVRGSHARQTSTTTATGSLSRTAHTATGGLLARGAAAKIAAHGARLSAGALFPGPSGLNPRWLWLNRPVTASGRHSG